MNNNNNEKVPSVKLTLVKSCDGYYAISQNNSVKNEPIDECLDLTTKKTNQSPTIPQLFGIKNEIEDILPSMAYPPYDKSIYVPRQYDESKYVHMPYNNSNYPPIPQTFYNTVVQSDAVDEVLDLSVCKSENNEDHEMVNYYNDISSLSIKEDTGHIEDHDYEMGNVNSENIKEETENLDDNETKLMKDIETENMEECEMDKIEESNANLGELNELRPQQESAQEGNEDTNKVIPEIELQCSSPEVELTLVRNPEPCVIDLTAEIESDSDGVEIVYTEQKPAMERRRRKKKRTVVDDSLAITACNITIDVSNDTEISIEPSSSRMGQSSNSPILFGDVESAPIVIVETPPPPQTLSDSPIPLREDNILRVPSYNLRERNNRRTRQVDYSEPPLPEEFLSILRQNDALDERRRQRREEDIRDVITAEPFIEQAVDDVRNYEESLEHANHMYSFDDIFAAGPSNLPPPNFPSTPKDTPNSPPYRPRSPGFSLTETKKTEDHFGELSCPICFEPFAELKKAGSDIVATICGHTFCRPCLEESLKNSRHCPNCRKKLNKKQYHNIYLNFF